jgi:hypothetical protein
MVVLLSLGAQSLCHNFLKHNLPKNETNITKSFTSYFVNYQ